MTIALAAMLLAPPYLIAPPFRQEECPLPFVRTELDHRQLGRDPLGDAWEMVEVSCWRGTWLRRGRSNIFDGYWLHPQGERQLATLRITVRGKSVSVIRRHRADRYCHYTGRISEDWRTVVGEYSCDWAPGPMRWQGQIIRIDESEPRALR